MKFDVVVGNPPFDGGRALHQQIFNCAFKTLSPTGTIVFIQPATMYMNKKDVHRKPPELEMVESINAHASHVEFKWPEVFTAATIRNILAITVASPSYSGSIHVKYPSGKEATVENVSGVNQLELDQAVFESLKAKYADMCKRNGSFGDVCLATSERKAFIAQMRSTGPRHSDFFTIVPRGSWRVTSDKFTKLSDHEFGIPLESPEHLENFYHYCETNFARMALALLKTSPNSGKTEMALVPLMDFSRTYTDEELYALAGFSESEIEIIEGLLPDYYNRKAKIPENSFSRFD